MGSSISCNNCTHPTSYYFIKYEHDEIEEYADNNNMFKQIKEGKPITSISHFIGAPLTFAREKLKEIEPIVGKVYSSMGHEFSMNQYLCINCYKKIDFDKVPEEWGINSEFKAEGWQDFKLP